MDWDGVVVDQKGVYVQFAECFSLLCFRVRDIFVIG
jgi:hypothetical protein